MTPVDTETAKYVLQLERELAQVTKERDELKRVNDGLLANIGDCGACAEGLLCGSAMSEHDGCPIAQRDQLAAEKAALERERDELKLIRLRDSAVLEHDTKELASLRGRCEVLADERRVAMAERDDFRKERDATLAQLAEHHRWHLGRTDRTPVYFGDRIGQVNAEEYADSGLCEDTLKALKGGDATCTAQSTAGAISTRDVPNAPMVEHQGSGASEVQPSLSAERCCLCGEPILYAVEKAQLVDGFAMHSKCWRERIEEPRSKVASLQSEYDEAKRQWQLACDAKQAQVEKLRVDEKRLDWLENARDGELAWSNGEQRGVTTATLRREVFLGSVTFTDGDVTTSNKMPGDLRSAIDAALAQEPTK